MGRVRRIAIGVLSALVISGFLVAVTESPADAAKVGNPGGSFAIRVHSGVLAVGSEGFDFVDEGRTPQCSDGTNNDGAQDSAIDAPDGQCDAGGVGNPEANDDSETQDGFQPKLPIQMTNGTVAADGTFTFPQSGVSFPQQWLYVDVPSPYDAFVDDFIVTITISAVGSVTGTINPLNGAMDLDMTVRVDLDGENLDSGCSVQPIVINDATTGSVPAGSNVPAMSGSPYNTSTGRMTLVQNTFSVPGAAGCGSVFGQNVNDMINDELGLPSASGRNSATFVAEWTPKRPTPGITASFTTTPSSGVDPLNVNVNASASTGSGLTYRWDWTNDGSLDTAASSTPTASHVFSAGTHTIRLRVTDSGGDFVETTRQITVGPNQPPTAADQTVSTPEETAKSITLGGTDPEGAALTTSLVSPAPLHGTVTGTPPNVTYTPALNYNGPDSFGFRVTDNLGNFDNGLITVNVTPTNDAPVASNVSATVTEDGSTTVNLVASDVDFNPLTYTIVTPPTKGVLSGTGASRTYQANSNEVGSDSFTYTANDGTGAPNATSNVATGNITITPVNDQPVADDQVGGNAVVVGEDAIAFPITLTGSDVDGDTLTFGIVDPPDHGTLGGSLPNITYTPAANYNGPDSFIFNVTDPLAASDNGVVDIVVTPGNDPPTTGDLNVATNQDTDITVTIPGSDPDADPLTFTPLTPTANGGTVSCTGDQCTFTPASGFAGVDSFTVDVSDGTASATSTVTVNVSAVNNTPPVINDATVVGLEDSTRSFSLVSADADGHPRSHSVLSQPSHGTLTCDAAGACTFVPNTDANGTATAQVQVSDGFGGVDTATITIIVVPLNDAPTVPAQSLTTAEDTPATIELAAGDVDGDTLTWSIKIAPSKGALACDAAGACTYTPNANAVGSDSFQVEVDDGNGARVRITVPVTLTPMNDAPNAPGTTRSLDEEGSATFNLAGNDIDGDPLTFTAAPAVNGTLSCSAAGVCSFTAAANANGTETIAYTVDDGTTPVTGALTLVIVPVNDAPVAVSQTVTTPEDIPIGITLAANDSDVGDPLAFQVTSAPAQGLLGGTAPNLTYVPAPNASGTASLAFRVTDAAGATSTATVTIVVAPVDDQPEPGNPSVTTAEDTAKAIALTGTDAEGPVTAAVVTGPAHGTYSGGVYTPALNYNGPDTIAYKVTSNTGQIANGTVTITITPVNDPPVAADGTVVTTRTVPVAITLGATDPDGPAGLTFTVLTGPTKGTLSGTAPNLTYNPTGFNTGSDNITFRVTDSAGVSDSGTIGITITGGPALATQLVAAPATVIRPNPVNILAKNQYNNLSGTLTTVGTNLPVSGRTVSFSVAGKLICSATTNASGVATCSGKGPQNSATTYQAVHVGNSSFAGSTGTGTLS